MGSLSVADAALGWPPPLKGRKTADRSMLSVRMEDCGGACERGGE